MARVSALGGKRIEQYNSPNQGGAMSAHHGVVLHIAQGTYRGTISWQLNPNQRYESGQKVTTCSTWIVGREPGEWAQMVDTKNIAWCQRGGSKTWLSIELAGYAPHPPTAWQIEACAQILAWLHRTHGIPVAIADHPGERGLGHHSMDRESWGEEWGHESCPGSGVVAAKPAIVTRARAILAGEDDDMPTVSEIWSAKWGAEDAGERLAMAAHSSRDALAEIRATRAAVTALAETRPGVDTAAILARMDALAAEDRQRDEAAAAHYAELRQLVERGMSGELAADEVVRLIGERLVATGGTAGTGSE